MKKYRHVFDVLNHADITYSDSLKSGSDKERKAFITRIGVMLAHLSNRTA
ncbi:MAG: hypothetical protein II487_06495 [Schwartzia sp.]|nr:hypothetical protein [Schwartzia sp. (in: firmicutes)]